MTDPVFRLRRFEISEFAREPGAGITQGLGIMKEPPDIAAEFLQAAPAAFPPLPAYRPPVAPKPRAEIPGARAVPPPAAVTPVSPLSAVLRSRDGIRQAIVLREILGPPKALAL